MMVQRQRQRRTREKRIERDEVAADDGVSNFYREPRVAARLSRRLTSPSSRVFFLSLPLTDHLYKLLREREMKDMQLDEKTKIICPLRGQNFHINVLLLISDSLFFYT